MKAAIVTINDRSWLTPIAETPEQLTNGLRGIESIPERTGMLFFLGSSWNYVPMNTYGVLFPIDIVFVNSALKVVGVHRNMQPEQDMVFTDAETMYILEVNASETGTDEEELVEVGDDVSIQVVDYSYYQHYVGEYTPTQEIQPLFLESIISTVVNVAVTIIVVTSLIKMTVRTVTKR